MMNYQVELLVLTICCHALFVHKSAVHAGGAKPTCAPVTLSLCYQTGGITSLDVTKKDLIDNSYGILPSKRRRTINKERSEEKFANDVIKWHYNITTYPTFSGDRSLQEVEASLSALYPLISTSCSKYITLFLCSVYSPVCTPRGVVPPCFELCERVKRECQMTADMFGIEWPERLSCDYFPSSYSQSRSRSAAGSEGYYEEANNMYFISRQTSAMWAEALLDDGKVCIPPSDDDVIFPVLVRLQKEDESTLPNKTEPYPEFGVWCPSNMKAPPGHNGYTFMGLPNCTAPCPNMYLENEELWIVRYVVLVLAVICVVVTSFTLLTFSINTKRFGYPERPIVFYAFCYLVISIVFLVGFILAEQVACNEEIINEENEVVQGFAVVEGSHHQLCSVIFMILYYFTVSGTIWWLILTFTWLLAAGFKWSNEAVESYHFFYHTLAWGIPAFQTVVVFISNKVEGDNIVGVCFVGLYDVDGLRYLLLLPMCTYLIIGIIVLFTGFFCLNRVRKSLQDDQENKEKLAKFMIRIGVFSVLYILPQIALIIIYAVEEGNRQYWEAAWYVRSCEENGVPCPSKKHEITVSAEVVPEPGPFLFCMKYILFLVVALPPLFWVGSRKTLDSWKNFCSDLIHPRKESVINTTVDRLLNDSNGPHAKDLQAKLAGKLDNTEETYIGKFGDADLRGSSASVAAQYVSKGRSRAWEDISYSESTDSLTSYTDTEWSRILAEESHMNRDTRVIGRKNMSNQHRGLRSGRKAERSSKKDGYFVKSNGVESSCKKNLTKQNDSDPNIPGTSKILQPTQEPYNDGIRTSTADRTKTSNQASNKTVEQIGKPHKITKESEQQGSTSNDKFGTKKETGDCKRPEKYTSAFKPLASIAAEKKAYAVDDDNIATKNLKRIQGCQPGITTSSAAINHSNPTSVVGTQLTNRSESPRYVNLPIPTKRTISIGENTSNCTPKPRIPFTSPPVPPPRVDSMKTESAERTLSI
ncbi:frizzled-2-like isoform X2 [Clavelina lepadiformis]|uniref:frizzled-2-like isoform X2 n=1 Tax=Clavelina lepadiformis TaxID=159417 RepID=UPI004040F98E